MKIGKCFILCFILIFGTLSYGLDSVSITADPGSNVLNEWKSPGRYSPINAFDGDLKTCYAEGWREMNTGVFEIKFDRCITIDELRFAAGYFKSKSLFEKIIG